MAKRKKRAVAQYEEPTPEQFARANYAKPAHAYRIIPVIDTMAQAGKLSARQHTGLARYRDAAHAEERSPCRDSLDKALHGRSGGQGIPLGAMRAAIELGRLESALGSLRDIARAVAVEDMTVSQWAVAKGGSPQRRASTQILVTLLGPRRKWLDIAMMEIKMAGERLAAAIGA